jgi:hypothetical protein
MADVIHMESEPVSDVGRMLGRLSEKIDDVQAEIILAAQGMDWDSSAKNYFLQDANSWAIRMYSLSKRCAEKGSAVTKEEEEWEDAAREFIKRYTPFVKGADDIDSKVDISDIHQGGYGDCFFMSSMGAIARKHPEFIEKMIHDNGDGTYTVTFYDPHCLTPLGPCFYTEHKVTVDNNFPENLADPMDATSDGTQEAWTLILEKAYMQWQKENGLDPAVYIPSPSIAMSVMTGKDCFNCPSELMTIDDLNRRFQNGDAITAGSSGTFVPNRPPEYFGDTALPGQKIPEGHVFFVTGVDPVNNTVTVQNPWGPDHDPYILTMSFEDYQKCFWLTTTNPVE